MDSMRNRAVSGMAIITFMVFAAIALSANPVSSSYLYEDELRHPGPFRINSSTLQIFTGYESRVFIDGQGRVGIGTASPSDRLNVNGTLRVDNETGSPMLLVNTTSGYVGVGTSSPAYLLDVGGTLHVNSCIGCGGSGFWSRSGTYTYLTNSGDDVGIGTDSPAYKLDVDGDLAINLTATNRLILPSSNDAATPTISFGDGDTGFYESNDDSFELSVGGAKQYSFLASGLDLISGTTVARIGGASNEDTYFNTGGNVGIGTTSPGDYNSGANNLVIYETGDGDGITIASDSDQSGYILFANGTSGGDTYRGYMQYNHSADKLVLGTAASDQAVIDTSGNVGIGTTSPAERLVVKNGDLLVSRDSATAAPALLTASDDASNSELLCLDNTASGGHEFRFRNDASIGLIIDDEGTPRWTFEEGGNFGIGTTSPAGKLESYRNDSTTSGNSNRNLYIHNSGTGDAMIGWLSNSDTLGFGMGLDSSNSAFVIGGHSNDLSSNPLVTVKQTGEVGIGTTSPSQKMEIFDDTHTELAINSTDATSEYNAGIGLYNKNTTWKIVNRYNTGGQLQFYNLDLGAEAMVIGKDGNVGIGTTNPSAKLHISSNSDTNSDFLIIEDIDSTEGSQIPKIEFKNSSSVIGTIRGHDTRGLQLGGGAGTQHVTIDSSGNVGIGTASPGISGSDNPSLTLETTSGNPGFEFSVNSDSINDNTGIGIFRWYTGTGNNLVASIAGVSEGTSEDGAKLGFWTKPSGGSVTEHMTIKGSGNVGIGTTIGFEVDSSGNAYIGTATTAGKIYFETGHTTGEKPSTGTTKVTIDGNTGDVGIGTTSPKHKLHVSGGHIILDNNNEIRFMDSDGTTERTALLYASDDDLEIWNSGGNILFQGGGNVGIGRSSASSILHVGSGDGTGIMTLGGWDSSESLNANANAFVFDGPGARSIGFHINGNDDGDVFYVATDPSAGSSADTIALAIENGGQVGIGTSSPSQNLDVSSSGSTYVRAQSTAGSGAGYVLKNTEGAYTVYTNGGAFDIYKDGVGSRLYIESGGDVGIGDTSPSRLLDVDGYANFASGIVLSETCRLQLDTTPPCSTGTTIGSDNGVDLCLYCW